MPVVWYIRNAFDLGRHGYQEVRRTFECTEEFVELTSRTLPQRISERP